MTPINGHILVKVEKKPEKTATGIMMVKDEDNRLEKALVLAVSEEVSNIKAKQSVFYKNYHLFSLEVDGKEHNFLKAEDVLAIE